MAEVVIQQQTWTNLFSSAGVSVGTAIRVQNKGSHPVYLAESAASPTPAEQPPRGWSIPAHGSADVAADSVGLWAISESGEAKVFVQEIGSVGGIGPSGAASGGNAVGVQSVSAATRNCVGRETLSVTAGAVATLTPPAGAYAATLQVDGVSSVSLTLDGATAPTATIGLRLDDGVVFYVDSPLSAVKLIARTSTVNVQAEYFDRP